ncbi:MAG TPA: GtrA family protein [Solirubrobacteraceae bacterium]|nr:GtrA family protein [Solirubrobacteraceae bacterium]
MTDEAAAVRVAAPAPRAAPAPLRLRLRTGVRQRESWLQLLRFGVVGLSGYVVNIAVFALALQGAGMPYPLAATLAFLVAVSNNFLWNRRWTFRRDEHHRPVHHQAARFLTVSVAAFLAGLGLLTLLVEAAGVQEVPAQAIAIVAVTPLSFLANKLWSFGR